MKAKAFDRKFDDGEEDIIADLDLSQIRRPAYEQQQTSMGAEVIAVKTLNEIKQWLTQNKPLLQERYQVKELGIFGSYARQEQTATSDVDVLVEFSKTPSLLKFVNLENYLSDSLGVKVDLVHKSGLKPRIGERILAEVIYL